MWQSQNQSQVYHYHTDPNQQQQHPPQSYPQQQYYYPPNNQTSYSPPQGQQFNMNQADPEDPEAKGIEFTDGSIRKAFIRKVFAILSVQLSLTLGVISLFIFVPSVSKYVFNNFWLFIVAIVLLFILLIMLACCENLRRSSPTNYIMLFLLTVCMSFMLGVTSATYSRNEVFIAVGITAVVTIGLTIFALQTKWDFTTMGGVLFVSVIILVIFGIFASIFRNNTLTLVYASIGALLFCIYLVYDIQLMMGGKHKYSISPEEYIFAALNLYIDIVNIFMYILMIIGASKN
ncbi:protein lifeguard 1-like isoform X1 [Chironomus tepperi]|uniref:protein lifeguard 1-like isoform X1 n=1 Tax=Chironomus tepperi TaxID=113505 RepID=UPI00391F3DBB